MKKPARLEHLPPYLAGRSAVELCSERGVTDVVELAANENPLGAPDAAVRAVREAATAVHRYPDGSARSLRGALARSLGVGEDMVLVAGGAEQVLGLLAQALLEPGLAAVVPRPSFPVYRSVTIAAGGDAREVDLPGWEFDVDAAIDRLDERVRLVFVASPNNPTGTYPAAPALDRLLDALPDGALLVLDEAYREYADAPDVPDGVALAGRDRRVALVRTLSKAYGLAGLRVGYLVGHPTVVDVAARVRPAFAVSGPAERAGVAALGDAEHLQRTRAVNREGRSYLAAQLAARGLVVTPSQANFLWVDTGRDDDMVWDRLLDHGVAVRSGALWGHPGHVRVTVGTESQNRRFLAALDAVLGGGAEVP